MTTHTPFIDLIIPTVGTSITYVADYNSNWEKIDGHNHATTGNALSQSSIDWFGIPLDGAPVSDIGLLSITESTPVNGSLYVSTSNNDLYYQDYNGADIRLTQNGQISLVGSYNGFYGNLSYYNAGCVYSSSSSTYTFNSTGDTEVVCNTLTVTEDSTTNNFYITGPITIDGQEHMYYDPTFSDSFDIQGGFTTLLIDENGQARACGHDASNIDQTRTPYTVLSNTTHNSKFYGLYAYGTGQSSLLDTNRNPLPIGNLSNSKGVSGAIKVEREALSPYNVIRSFTNVKNSYVNNTQQPIRLQFIVSGTSNTKRGTVGGFNSPLFYNPPGTISFSVRLSGQNGSGGSTYYPFVYASDYQVIYTPTTNPNDQIRNYTVSSSYSTVVQDLTGPCQSFPIFYAGIVACNQNGDFLSPSNVQLLVTLWVVWLSGSDS